MNSKWIKRFTPVPNPALNLFCFPHAGASAACFYEWSLHFAKHNIAVLALQLPGRADRIAETPADTMQALAGQVVHAIAGECRSPFALFGHSLGGFLAFEIAGRLEPLGRLPRRLVVSGCWPPNRPRAPSAIYLREGQEFLDAFQAHYGPLPPEIVTNTEMRDLILPVIRMDLKLVETYTFDQTRILNCPLSVYGGQDDHLAPASQLSEWRRLSRGSFRQQIFDGSHLFIQSAKTAIWDALLRDLAPGSC